MWMKRDPQLSSLPAMQPAALPRRDTLPHMNRQVQVTVFEPGA